MDNTFKKTKNYFDLEFEIGSKYYKIFIFPYKYFLEVNKRNAKIWTKFIKSLILKVLLQISNFSGCYCSLNSAPIDYSSFTQCFHTEVIFFSTFLSLHLQKFLDVQH